MMSWKILQADLCAPDQARDFIQLLDAYARDPMGGACPLDSEVRNRLLVDLPRYPGFLSLLAYDGSRAIGLANAFPGYSTFRARPILNLHDIMVLGEYRQRGVAQALLMELERHARQRACCKLTLEVLQENIEAMSAYRRFGFVPYQLHPQAGEAVFWHKVLE